MPAGQGAATQGTAEPTHESAILLPKTVESTQQDSKEDGATRPSPQPRRDRDRDTEEATQAECSARAPNEENESKKELQVQSTVTLPSVADQKPKKEPDPESDPDVQHVGVLETAPTAAAALRVATSKPRPNKKGGTKEQEEHTKQSTKEADEKRAQCTSQATKRDKKGGVPRTVGSTGATVATATTQTTAGAGGHTRRRNSGFVTDSDRKTDGTTLAGTESKKQGGEKTTRTNDTMDYYQRRKKKELEKCRLMLTRNKQLVEIPSQRGEEHRGIEEELFFHGYLWVGDLDRMLKEDGQFLVRKSDYDGQEVFVISVMAQSEVFNLIIKQTTTKKLYWVFNFAFKSLVHLIDYHYKNNEPVDEASVYLRIPVHREDWQYSHEQIETATQLGSGNFGTVHNGYLKRHPFDPPVLVAIKTLTLGEDEDMSASDKNEFLREANLMLAVDHPNLVKLFGIAATRMPIQIVMELCNDTLLGKLKHHHHAWMFDVKDGILSESQKARYVLDSARGLEYLHSCYIIHRDIAARNVLIRDGQAKISDFGLSIIGGLKKGNMKNLPTKWCAPETLAQGHYSFHSDVFSFGALIYEVFSFGRPPYADYEAGLKGGALRNFIIYGGQAGCKLNPIDPHTPVWIKEMIDRCRQRDSYARPLFPELVRKLEAQLGSKAPSVGFWVTVRERFQKFIVDMISIADFAAKEEEYIKADLDWIALHSAYEELEDKEAQAALREYHPYLPARRAYMPPPPKKQQ